MEPEYQYYPGTNNVDSQGPSAGQAAGMWLDLDTPLDPYTRADGKPLASKDVVDIEGQLGFTYGPGKKSTSS